ncbi:MAG: apolipoprotein N-acyltransferase, partial [Steroidobacterales bacterium]
MRAAAAPLAALAAGALLACAFAPLNLWPLAVLCPALLMLLWEEAAPARAALLGFCFGVGTFGAGTWWLYISIHGFGLAPIWLTLLLVAALVTIMAAYYALLGYLAVRWLPPAGALRWFLGLPALWLLVEWWRGWFLSGFPWLSLGYSQTDTALRAYAPVLGVYGISALLLLQSGALVALLRAGHEAGRPGVATPRRRVARLRWTAALLLLLPWALGWPLARVAWTHESGPPLSVAILQ